MSETNRRRNIVLSYVRDGMSEGEAVRAADKLTGELEERRLSLTEQRTLQEAFRNSGKLRQTLPLNKEEGAAP